MIHIILRARNYARIKTQEGAKVEPPGEPTAEMTKLYW